MGVENANHINELNDQLPGPDDYAREGDDHLRLIKKVLTDDLPNIGGPVVADHAQLNAAAGHYPRTDNPHNTTAEQVGAAPAVHTHTLADITDDGTMAAVDDAAADGLLYGRKDNVWAQAAEAVHAHTLTDITDSGSMAAVDDAAADGLLYGRKDGAWAQAAEAVHAHTLADITDSGSMAAVDDAPSDGTGYVRKNGAWAAESGGGGGDGDMTKAVYDTNANDIVDKAEAVDDGGGNATTAAQVKAAYDHSQVVTGNPHNLDAGDVGADPAGSAATVQGNLDTHTADSTNPHSVTAAQAGADPAGSAATVQGNLDTHIADSTNPHSVTAAQVGAVPAAGGTFSGAVQFNTEAHFDAITDNGNSGASANINWTLGPRQKININQNTTLTFTNPSGPCAGTLYITNTGGFTVGLPANFKLPTGDTETPGDDAELPWSWDGTNYHSQVINFG